MTPGTGCKIRHGIGLQQVGPKPLIQAAVTGKYAKLSVTLIVCLDFARLGWFMASLAVGIG